MVRSHVECKCVKNQGVFITYATPRYELHAQKLCVTAWQYGFRSGRVFGPGDIDASFYHTNCHILSQQRGAGYWLWKPYVISKVLDQLEWGESLCYCDSLYEFCAVPNITQTTLFMNKPGQAWTRFLVKQFNKMDALLHFGLTRHYRMDGRQLWAGCLYLVKDARTVYFIKEWLRKCQDAHLLTDTPSNVPNHHAYKDHRHDQSILDALAKKHNIYVAESPHFLKNMQHERPR